MDRALKQFSKSGAEFHFKSVVCMKNTRTAKGCATNVGFKWLQILHRRFASSPSGLYLIG